MGRLVKDAVDLTTGEKVYYKSHAKTTYLSNNRNVEDVINEKASMSEVMAIIEQTITTVLNTDV